MLNQGTLASCQWCEGPFRARRGGSPQRFCSSKCRSAFWTALRRWGERAVAAGVLSLDQIREGAPEACMLLSDGDSLAPAPRHPSGQSAPVAPPERSDKAAEGSPFTETWAFRAIVAEAVTAALVKAMPRIIAAAVTGNTS